MTFKAFVFIVSAFASSFTFFIVFQHEAFSKNCICFRNLNPGEILMHDASGIFSYFFYVCDSVASFNIQERKKNKKLHIYICLRKNKSSFIAFLELFLGSILRIY